LEFVRDVADGVWGLEDGEEVLLFALEDDGVPSDARGGTCGVRRPGERGFVGDGLVGDGVEVLDEVVELGVEGFPFLGVLGVGGGEFVRELGVAGLRGRRGKLGMVKRSSEARMRSMMSSMSVRWERMDWRAPVCGSRVRIRMNWRRSA
jgi:hypothetical protein